MPSSELVIVPLDEIPAPPYETPSSDAPALYAVAKRMEHLCRNLGGLGLSAAQVGIPWRLFVALNDYPLNDHDFGIFFDCTYDPRGSESFPSIEGCLSLPGKRYKVSRYEKVAVRGKRLVESSDGVSCEDFSATFSGIPAVIMQHEIDHDQGRERMIDSIGVPVSIAWP